MNTPKKITNVTNGLPEGSVDITARLKINAIISYLEACGIKPVEEKRQCNDCFDGKYCEGKVKGCECVCLSPSTPKEGWEKEFIKKFYIYNLEKSTPAGAEKEAIEFIHQTITSEIERYKAELREKIVSMKDADYDNEYLHKHLLEEDIISLLQ